MNDRESYTLTTDRIVACYKTDDPLGILKPLGVLARLFSQQKFQFEKTGEFEYLIEIDTGNELPHKLHYGPNKKLRDSDYEKIRTSLRN